MHSSLRASSALFSVFSLHLSLNTHTHKYNIYSTGGSKGNNMKAYHSYIGEVYTCQLSCNHNQHCSSYTEWLTRLQPFVLLPQLFIEINFKSAFCKHKNKRHRYFQIYWIQCVTVTMAAKPFVSHGLTKRHIFLGGLAGLVHVRAVDSAGNTEHSIHWSWHDIQHSVGCHLSYLL